MNTTFHITITRATNNQRQAIIQLLKAAKLPADDLPAALDHFFVATEKGQVIGAIGVEPYRDGGLLRSMVVDPAHRNKKIAAQLVQRLEAYAATTGIHRMYLLTETAASYFERKGYQRVTRNEVPESVKASSEFSHLCPASATVMKKEL